MGDPDRGGCRPARGDRQRPGCLQRSCGRVRPWTWGGQHVSFASLRTVLRQCDGHVNVQLGRFATHIARCITPKRSTLPLNPALFRSGLCLPALQRCQVLLPHRAVDRLYTVPGW